MSFRASDCLYPSFELFKPLDRKPIQQQSFDDYSWILHTHSFLEMEMQKGKCPIAKTKNCENEKYVV